MEGIKFAFLAKRVMKKLRMVMGVLEKGLGMHVPTRFQM